MGVQAGSYCVCDNQYGRYGTVVGCTTNCPGNASETCGAGWQNEVYDIGSGRTQPTITSMAFSFKFILY